MRGWPASFLDLNYHIRASIDFIGCVDEHSARPAVIFVAQSDPRGRIPLDENLMSVRDDLPDGGRRQPHPAFLVLDFFGNTDSH